MNTVERLIALVLGWGIGIMIMLNLLKDTIRLGYSAMWGEKTMTKPAVLSDPSFGTHGFLHLEDIKIHYVASGPEDKPLMLFLHGFPEFWYSWRHQIKEFQKDFRVVAIDQRGYGESDKPKGIDAYMNKKLLSDIKQVIFALGYKKCTLVAHDWGGALGWAFGRLFPDMVDKLIIMNAPAAPVFEKMVKTHRGQQKMSWYMSFFQVPYVPELMLKSQNFKFSEDLLKGLKVAKVDKDDIDAYKYTFSQPGALTPPINWYRAAFQTQLHSYDMNYVIPVLLIWGVKDMALHIDLVTEMEKAFPKLEVKRIPEAGHFVQMDTPDLVNTAMREWMDKIDKN